MTEKIKCSLCGKVFSNENAYRSHLRRKDHQEFLKKEEPDTEIKKEESGEPKKKKEEAVDSEFFEVETKKVQKKTQKESLEPIRIKSGLGALKTPLIVIGVGVGLLVGFFILLSKFWKNNTAPVTDSGEITQIPVLDDTPRPSSVNQNVRI